MNTTEINFRYRPEKSTQAAHYLLSLSPGGMEYIRLIKLMYLADREALEGWGYSISTDRYVSMEHGTVLSRVLNHISENDSVHWNDLIQASKYSEFTLCASKECDYSQLSKREMNIIQEIYEKYKDMKTWDLIENVIHKLAEWDKSVAETHTSKPIPLENLLGILGYNETERKEILELAKI